MSPLSMNPCPATRATQRVRAPWLGTCRGCWLAMRYRTRLAASSKRGSSTTRSATKGCARGFPVHGASATRRGPASEDRRTRSRSSGRPIARPLSPRSITRTHPRRWMRATPSTRKSAASSRRPSNKKGRREAGPRHTDFFESLAAPANAGVGGLRRADVEAGVGRIGRRRLAFLDVLQEVHCLISHIEGTLTDVSRSEALLQKINLHRQGIGDDKRERA